MGRRRATRKAGAGEERPTKHLGAGDAYLDAIRDDPEAQAALQRAQAGLRSSAEAMRDPEVLRKHEHAKREQEQAWKALAEAIQESLRVARQDLSELGFMPPKTLEDWKHLARVVEIPFETIRSGKFTLRDVYTMALAWADRQRVRETVAHRALAAAAKTAATRVEPSFTIAAVLDLAGLSNTALNKYAKLAGVATPSRGQKNFRYRTADVRKILQTIIDNVADRRILASCRTALVKLAEIT